MGLIIDQTVTLTADTDYEVDPGLDLSLFRDMTLIVNLTDSGAQAANHLDVYLQQRWQDTDNWIDRIHAVQFDGAQADARVQYTIQSDVLLAAGEQGSLAALAESTYRNGPFPPCVYAHEEINFGGPLPTDSKRPVSNCRVHCDVTDGGTPDPSFTVQILVYATGFYPIAN